MDYQEILESIHHEIEPFLGEGKVAKYIPALARVEPDRFAMSIQLFDGTIYSVGDADFRFSIQSISKVFAFTLALKHYRKALYQRIGHEPSGDPFNSLVQLEYEHGIPRNPFINAGAIVTIDTLYSIYGSSTFDEILAFIIKATQEESLVFDEEVFRSELECGYLNFALINMMKSYGNIKNSTQEVIETYFKQCSIAMSTKKLAQSMLFLANHGKNPLTNDRLVTSGMAKRINSVMLTCGHYDASGDFAYRVGLPGKSGVGGGIVAIVPEKMSICVYSPRLNKNGNSLAGTKALELFTTKTDLSIF